MTVDIYPPAKVQCFYPLRFVWLISTLTCACPKLQYLLLAQPPKNGEKIYQHFAQGLYFWKFLACEDVWGGEHVLLYIRRLHTGHLHWYCTFSCWELISENKRVRFDSVTFWSYEMLVTVIISGFDLSNFQGESVGLIWVKMPAKTWKIIKPTDNPMWWLSSLAQWSVLVNGCLVSQCTLCSVGSGLGSRLSHLLYKLC